MKCLPVLALLVSSFLSFGATAQTGPLAVFEGEKRPLLLFSRSRSDATLDRQVDALRELRPELDDRDMVVLVTAGTQDTVMAIGYASLPRGASRDLKRRFNGGNARFLAVLVGKDGTEKARWLKNVDPQVIFDLIDSMPMRQREIEAGEGATN